MFHTTYKHHCRYPTNAIIESKRNLISFCAPRARTPHHTTFTPRQHGPPNPAPISVPVTTLERERWRDKGGGVWNGCSRFLCACVRACARACLLCSQIINLIAQRTRARLHSDGARHDARGLQEVSLITIRPFVSAKRTHQHPAKSATHCGGRQPPAFIIYIVSAPGPTSASAPAPAQHGPIKYTPLSAVVRLGACPFAPYTTRFVLACGTIVVRAGARAPCAYETS